MIVFVMFIGFLSFALAIFSLIAMVQSIESNLHDGAAVGCFCSVLVFATLGSVMAIAIPSTCIYKNVQTVYYRPQEVIKSEVSCSAVVTYTFYNKITLLTEQLEMSKTNFCFSKKSSVFYADTDLARLLIATSVSNIVISMDFGKSIYGNYVCNSPEVNCLTVKEIENITINDNL